MQVKSEDRPNTTLSTHQGQFQWTVLPDSERVKAVKTKPGPMNVKELQSFLGLAGYNK